jgi:hypothetical protein
MSKKQLEHMLKLNISIIVILVLLFSEGFIGLKVTSTNTFEASIAITTMIVSLGILIYGNYKILFKKIDNNLINSNKLKRPKDWIEVLEYYTNQKETSMYTNLCIEQIGVLEKTLEQLDITLKHNFSIGDLTYAEFTRVIEKSKNVFLTNIEKLITHVNLISTQLQRKLSLESQESKKQKLQNNLLYIKSLTDNNEELLSELYNLNFELGKLNSSSDAENLETLEALKKLIDNVELYK